MTSSSSALGLPNSFGTRLRPKPIASLLTSSASAVDRDYARDLIAKFKENQRRRREIERRREADVLGSTASSAENGTNGFVFNHDDGADETDRGAWASALEIEEVELFNWDNAKRHHTDMYDIIEALAPGEADARTRSSATVPSLTLTRTNNDGEEMPNKTLILRRAFSFFMALRLGNRSHPTAKDRIRIIFQFGSHPSLAKGTMAALTLQGDAFKPSGQEFKKPISEWDIRAIQQDDHILMFEIQIPSLAPVGLWDLKIETGFVGMPTESSAVTPIPRSATAQPRSFAANTLLNSLANTAAAVARVKPGSTSNVYKCKQDIYILFNPFSEDDLVHMEDERHRQEYVFNETGKVWVGAHRKFTGRKWAYDQFDDSTLPAAMLLLELANITPEQRASPIKTVRALSAVINSADDDGMLRGRWDGEYSDGTAPYEWTGSAAILEEYLSSGGEPVKYGQCWVFSALTVTLCRALGIPCRSVTNFVSAHDTNNSLTIDKFFDENNDEIEGGPDGNTTDSIWNFHVWNDVWMERPDLPAGYGGWQAIDATPQEESENLFQCGPASLVAIRKGEIGFAYDTPFVFSEVNADLCHFKTDHSSDWGFTRMKLNTYHIGRRVVTKAAGLEDDLGDKDAEDITEEYKNPEGTASERLSIVNAVRGVGCTIARQYFQMPPDIKEDVFFDMIEIDKIPYGDSFSVTLLAKNNSDENRTVTAMLSANSIRYTGTMAQRIKRRQGMFTLKPAENREVNLDVSFDEYYDKLVDYCLIKIYAITSVEETKQTWSEEDDFQLEKPNLDIKVFDESGISVNKECRVEFSFTNPLKLTLTKCRFVFEGPGLSKPKMIHIRDVKPNEHVSHQERFVPKRSGHRRIIASFSSKQMVDVTGSTVVDVDAEAAAS